MTSEYDGSFQVCINLAQTLDDGLTLSVGYIFQDESNYKIYLILCVKKNWIDLSKTGNMNV